jgi:hypothetical protein
MKKVLVLLSALAMVATLQAGEKSDKSACCASTQAKGTTCSAKATASAGKSACCAKSMAAQKTDSFAVKGGTLLMQMAKR